MNSGLSTSTALLAAVVCALSTALCGIAQTNFGALAKPLKPNIILATTTSTQDSGLLDELLPVFRKKTGYFVKTIAVGSGQAMAMGRKGEADMLLVHSPDAEKEFVADGFGVNRRVVMHNDFVIVGPTNDPAGVRGCNSAAAAMQRIVGTKSLFMSRGDNSGTHALEKKLWKEAGLNPDGIATCQQTGQGMGQTLGIASEKGAYTLADRGTWLALRKRLDLAVLCEGQASLLNVYHVIEVSAGKWPKVNKAGARALADFMVSEEAQNIISKFGTDKFGSPLFTPDAGRENP